MNNYADTITMFLPCSFDLQKAFTNRWSWDTSNPKKSFHCFVAKTFYCFFRYFPYMFEEERLYVTFSLPKLYCQSKSNTFPVTNYTNTDFWKKFWKELSLVLDSTKLLPLSLSDWQPSRLDLFRMRKINSVDREEYSFAYSRLGYRGVATNPYWNTNYLASSKSKRPSVLLRTYNKTIEQKNKAAMTAGTRTVSVIADQCYEKLRDSDPVDWFRYEFSLKRAGIKRYCEKYGIAFHMQAMMREDVQKILLNDLVQSRKLHCTIYNKKEFRKVIKTVLKSKKSVDLAIKLAASIRNKHSSSLTTSQRQRIIRELGKQQISIITTNFVTIKGLPLL